MKKVKMSISGMHCASCASNVQKSLLKTEGVKSANVNVIMKKGYADIEDNVTVEELKKAVKRAGYELNSVEFE